MDVLLTHILGSDLCGPLRNPVCRLDFDVLRKRLGLPRAITADGLGIKNAGRLPLDVAADLLGELDDRVNGVFCGTLPDDIRQMRTRRPQQEEGRLESGGFGLLREEVGLRREGRGGLPLRILAYDG